MMKRRTITILKNSGFPGSRVLLNGRSFEPAEHGNGLGNSMVRLGLTTRDCSVAVQSEINVMLRGKQIRMKNERKNGDRPIRQFL